MVGRMIGHYRILEEIGRGGMGVVYKALDTRLNRPVAIKSLQTGETQDEIAKKRFVREALMVAALDHPYICKVYEVLEQNGQSFIVLEFVHGRRLSALMGDPARMLPLDKILEVGREIAEALEEAHKKGIVHRDIKPNNIMVLEPGHIKVLDFGLAKALPKLDAEAETETASEGLTERGQVLGTRPYMSPEQISGQPADNRSDIFSFGIVLFEMIAGRRPFSGASAAQLAASIMTEDPEPLHRYRHGVPDSLDRIIRRMLAKDPNERYQSVHEVWVELRHVRGELVAQSPRVAKTLGQTGTMDTPAAGAGAAAGPVAPPAPPVAVSTLSGRRWLSSRPVRWAFAVTPVLAMVVAVLWYQGSQPALSFAERDWVLLSDFENVTGDAIFDKSLWTALNVSLSQSKYVNVFSKSRTGAVLQRMGKKPDTAVDEQVGREVCQRENIRGLICPTIGKVGDRFIVTARVVDPQTGDSVRSYAHEATDNNQVLSALDDVATSLRRGLGESLTQVSANNRPLAKVTTTSLSALKSYSEAAQLWTKQQHAAALALMQSAVKEDPDFAMAHAALGVFYAGFGINEPTKAKEHYQKSLSLADRTTDREKMVIRLQYENRYGTADTARALFENYLRAYPDSIAQRYNYGDMLRNHGELDKAVGQYREVIRIAPDHAPSHINLATTYSDQGKTQEALAFYERAFKLEPTLITSENLNHEYGFILVDAGEYDKARQVFTQGLSTPIRPAALRSMALLHLYQGQYREARRDLTEALVLNVSAKNLFSEARNHLFMSILLDGEGDSAGVQRELDKAARCLETLTPPPWLGARIGVAWARGGSIDKAVRILEKVRKDVNPNNAGQNSDLHRLEGELELARGNRVRGLELLTLADRDTRGPLSIESLARGQQIAGKTDEAIASYEAFMGTLHTANGWEPQQYWFAAHVPLAKLYIERKEVEKARRVLDRLLSMWKAADPNLPLFKEAQRLSQAIASGPH